MPKDRLRKGYIDTRAGQTHFRTAGAGDRGLVLIHWTPLSSRMFADVAPLFAEQGFCVFAPDLLGYGRSDPRPTAWSMADWASIVLEAARGFGLRRASVLGGHTGAAVAAELAIAAPEFVEAVALDGCPFLTPALKAAFAAMAASPRPTPSEEGAHERLAFLQTAGLRRHYRPDITLEAEGLEPLWPMMIDVLETDWVSSAPVSASYDIADRLALITPRLAFLGAELDSLAASLDQARTIRPDAPWRRFKGADPVHDPARADEFVVAATELLSP
jgi:pimeloyl-ACP methyl ester carboxylesterase